VYIEHKKGQNWPFVKTLIRNGEGRAETYPRSESVDDTYSDAREKKKKKYLLGIWGKKLP